MPPLNKLKNTVLGKSKKVFVSVKQVGVTKLVIFTENSIIKDTEKHKLVPKISKITFETLSLSIFTKKNEEQKEEKEIINTTLNKMELSLNKYYPQEEGHFLYDFMNQINFSIESYQIDCYIENNEFEVISAPSNLKDTFLNVKLVGSLKESSEYIKFHYIESININLAPIFLNIDDQFLFYLKKLYHYISYSEESSNTTLTPSQNNKITQRNINPLFKSSPFVEPIKKYVKNSKIFDKKKVFTYNEKVFRSIYATRTSYFIENLNIEKISVSTTFHATIPIQSIYIGTDQSPIVLSKISLKKIYCHLSSLIEELTSIYITDAIIR